MVTDRLMEERQVDTLNQALRLMGGISFLAGEGAGYAGGIMSAGVDGIEVAQALAMSLAPIRSASGTQP